MIFYYTLYEYVEISIFSNTMQGIGLTNIIWQYHRTLCLALMCYAKNKQTTFTRFTKVNNQTHPVLLILSFSQ